MKGSDVSNRIELTYVGQAKLNLRLLSILAASRKKRLP